MPNPGILNMHFTWHIAVHCTFNQLLAYSCSYLVFRTVRIVTVDLPPLCGHLGSSVLDYTHELHTLWNLCHSYTPYKCVVVKIWGFQCGCIHSSIRWHKAVVLRLSAHEYSTTKWVSSYRESDLSNSYIPPDSVFNLQNIMNELDKCFVLGKGTAWRGITRHLE